MSFEAKIDTLIAALNDNTAALRASGSTPAATTATKAAATTEKAAPVKEKASKPSKPAGPTKEEVVAAAKAYASEHTKDAAKALIKKHGGADLASLPEANWAAFVEATKGAPEDETAEEDDGL